MPLQVYFHWCSTSDSPNQAVVLMRRSFSHSQFIMYRVFTLGISLLVRIPTIDKASGSIQLVLHLHMKFSRLAESVACSWITEAGKQSSQRSWKLRKKIKRVCVCVYLGMPIPLQFFAILNMLAALAYISHASSTLWFPLQETLMHIYSSEL